MNIYPDNYLYYIFFFTFSIFCGTHLLFSYNKNKLIVLNASMFFLVAIRFSTEYYLPSTDSFRIATNIAIFHHLVVAIISFLLKYCAWFYIRPFKGWKWESLVNKIYFWIILLLPYIFIRGPIIFGREVFTFEPEKMDGYWRFATDKSHLLYQIRTVHSDFTYYILIIVLIWSIYKDNRFWLRKTLLFLSFFLVPYLIKQHFFADLYNIPNIAIFHFANALILSWFITEYRLFKDGFGAAQKDLLNSISDFAISTELDLNVTHANEKAKKLFSINNPTSFVQILTKFSHLTTQKIEQQIQKLLGHPENELELNLELPTIGEKIFSLKAAPFKKEQFQIGHTFLLKDLTDIREKEQQLEVSNATKDQLFAIISHDLRKPALSFRGIGKKINYLLQKKEFIRLQQLGTSLEQSALNLNKLLDNLLKWALSQKKALKSTSQAYALRPIFDDIIALFQPVIEEKEIIIHIDVPPEITLIGDRDIVTTILRNLMDNSIKFTPLGKQIRVVAKSTGTTVTCTIKDAGVGMTTDQIEKIFQLDNTKSQQGTEGEKGVGLGMVLVKELVATQKGSIEISSELNKGTLIELSLPTS